MLESAHSTHEGCCESRQGDSPASPALIERLERDKLHKAGGHRLALRPRVKVITPLRWFSDHDGNSIHR